MGKEESSVLDRFDCMCERNSQMEMSYWRSGETKIQIWEPSARMTVKASVMNSITSGRYVALGQWFSTRGNFAPQIPGDATGI